MLFNSDVFLRFFAGFLLLYYLVRNHLQARNILIVLASYVFYGSWDYRFLLLLIISSLLDYGVGLGLEKIQLPAPRKALVTLSIMGNLSILGFFKYYDFFVDTFTAFCARVGLPFDLRTLGIVLPVGISFYTFQTMSYALDVYRRQMAPTHNLINFLAYVSFFPQLVAGPISRAHHLLPQFERTRCITRANLEEGVWLMIWGMFKKVVLADNLAPLVDMVYQHSVAHSGPMVALGTIAFAFQIYCDFSGYSDIARGTARILGFNIMINFNLPYFAASIREFWQRWHISLSTWLRDYLYISLGGNRRGEVRTYVNLFVTMLLGGLWHGAAWNFVLWGIWHGSGLIIQRMLSPRSQVQRPRTIRNPARFCGWALTMAFVFYGWLLFRAASLDQIVSFTMALGDFSVPVWIKSYVMNLIVFISPLVIIQIFQYRMGNVLAPLAWPTWVRGPLQGLLLIGIMLYWEKKGSPFIYFQF